MPDETYRIIYEGVPDKANRAIDALIAKFARGEQAIDKFNAKLRAVGANTSGLTRIENVLKAIAAASGVAEKELKDVGKGNSSVTDLTRRLAALEAQLKDVTAAGHAAGTATAGIGKGAGGGAGGGGQQGGGGRASGVRTLLATGIAMQGLRKLGQAYGDSLGGRREFLSQAADTAAAYRADLTGLGVLKDKNAPGDAEMREDLAFQKKTLLGRDESSVFRLEFGGAISPSLKARDKQGNPRITPETAKQLEVEAARFTARYGLDATTGGRMAGLLGVTQKVPDAKTGVAILAHTMEQLNVEGVGQVKDLAGQMFALSGGMLAPQEDGEGGGGGRFPSYPAMAARFAAATVSKVGRADNAKTMIQRADRMMRKFDGAKNGNEAFLRAQGITPDDDFETAIHKIAPAVLAKGGDQRLKDAGFANSAERLAVIEAAKLNKQVDDALADPAKKAKAERAIQDSDAYAGTMVGRNKAAEIDEFASAVELGLTAERMKIGRTAARARMGNPNQPGGQRLKAGLGQSLLDMSNSAYTGGGITGEELRVDAEMFRGLVEGGRKVGVDVRKMAPNAAYNADKLLPLDSESSQREINAAWQAIEKAGGDPMGGAPRNAAKALRNAANALDAMGGARQGPPPPGDGGAGFNPGRR